MPGGLLLGCMEGLCAGINLGNKGIALGLHGNWCKDVVANMPAASAGRLPMRSKSHKTQKCSPNSRFQGGMPLAVSTCFPMLEGIRQHSAAAH